MISTLGVLGTFLGITIGLWFFNTQDINSSIPKLLEGLKTAFFTSLSGMICSLLLNRRVDALYDDYETKQKGESRATDLENAAGMIVKAVESMSMQSKSDSESMRKAIEDLYKHSIPFQDDSLSKQDKVIDLLSGGFEKMNANLTELSSVLHKEVMDIEHKMSETNSLLTSKFDEFSELLKKSNTEALVEVMKTVTEEFQKQMNELISRLVKENFDKLNQSVDQLNTWQIENKEMIQSLTNQYMQMETQFSETETTLVKVGEDTRLLVSEGGKLQQLISALNSVMVQDEKFVQITSNLSATTEFSKQNMEAFKESTDQLNDWVRKQRNFVEAVQELIVKLEEISKLKDYSEEFWKGQKQGMADSLGALKQGSLTLNSQLTALDQRFYNRLNATLAELDTCIQAMVNGRR
ncbi:MAG: hypothetical protein J6Y37_17135 [Paludibacteraceae bacterium]|nr:hypothetical protein [Paludibacteraceae bacterium]